MPFTLHTPQSDATIGGLKPKFEKHLAEAKAVLAKVGAI